LRWACMLTPIDVPPATHSTKLVMPKPGGELRDDPWSCVFAMAPAVKRNPTVLYHAANLRDYVVRLRKQNAKLDLQVFFVLWLPDSRLARWLRRETAKLCKATKRLGQLGDWCELAPEQVLAQAQARAGGRLVALNHADYLARCVPSLLVRAPYRVGL
jgi:hypothetical protein